MVLRRAARAAERVASSPRAREYARLYGLNAARAERLKPDAVVLHPGPDQPRAWSSRPTVADGPRSVILEQVANGVAVRMAILEACAMSAQILIRRRPGDRPAQRRGRRARRAAARTARWRQVSEAPLPRRTAPR